MTTLEAQLAALPEDLKEPPPICGFNAGGLTELAKPLQRGVPADNLVKGSITPPAPGDVVQLPTPGSAERARRAALGEAARARGSVARAPARVRRDRAAARAGPRSQGQMAAGRAA